MAQFKKQTTNQMVKDISADAEKFLKKREEQRSYSIQQKILQGLVNEYRDHSNYEAVELKAKLLNMFYSTGIQAINMVVNRIMSIKDIDEVLNEEKYSKKPTCRSRWV